VKSGPSPETELPKTPTESNKAGHILSLGAWLVAAGLVILAAYMAWRLFSGQSINPISAASPEPAKTVKRVLPLISASNKIKKLPAYAPVDNTDSIPRLLSPHTLIPNRPRQEVIQYEVQQGDSVFEVAEKFNITPETVLWANYDQLDDNPHLISPGMELYIPPLDGVLYEWQEGDTVEGVANNFDASPDDILAWSDNNFDLAEPRAEPGTLVMVPGGQREFRQWLIPTIPRGSAGVSKSVYGQGACEGSYDGAYGTGAFVWPTWNHILSGNDYWSGHLGIDIAAGIGAAVYAADSGVVVFAGWATGGYGNTVIVDHGNGYQTLYGHLNSVAVACGYSVSQGAVVGYAGSTGNSTGSHLHFEVRYMGGFISPWYVLPAP